MPNFSEKSRNNLKDVDSKLVRLLSEAIKIVDFSINEGYRSPERQKQLYKEGKTQVLLGKHNKFPSEAVDIYPSPYNGGTEKDIRQLYYIVGVIKALSLSMDIKTRLGLDWDGDYETRDENFVDAFHLELK